MINFWQKFLSASGGSRLILALAPMAGVTDSAFRQICRQNGADVVYTEMVSADGLYYNSKKTLEFLKFNKTEQPIVIQLFGKDPLKFIKAARLCEGAGFSGIDINFGCPARKVVGHGGGVTLMRDLGKCRQIIEAVLAGAKLPVSVKLRSAINRFAGAKEKITALDFIKFMKDLPLAAIMIHGRPYEQPFSGEIDYELIKKCVQLVKAQKPEIIILANGGINSPEDAEIMLNKTNADGLGLARGLCGRPWLFQQIKDYLKSGRYHQPDIKQIKKIILRHGQLAFKNKGRRGILELRKHLLWYVSGWPREMRPSRSAQGAISRGWLNASALRKELVKVENINDLKKILKAV